MSATRPGTPWVRPPSRRMTWALALWSAYVAIWAILTDPGTATAALWWCAGTVVFGLPWLFAQLVRQQRAASVEASSTGQGPGASGALTQQPGSRAST